MRNKAVLRRLRAGALVSASALVLAACSSGGGGAASGSDPYQVAVLADLTGSLAVSFEPSAAGFQTYVDMVNQQGGVNGRQVQAMIYDGQSNPDVALTSAQKAVGKAPIGFVQMSGSAATARVQPIVTDNGIPFVGGALADSAVYPPKPNVFQVGLTASQQAQGAVAETEARLGSLQSRTVDIAGSNTPYVDVIINEVVEELKAKGATIGRTERFEIGIPSFAAQAANIAQNAPDAVLLFAPANDTVNAAVALSQAGLRSPIIGFNGAASREVLQRIGSPNYFAPTEVSYPDSNSELMAVAKQFGREKDVAASQYSSMGWVTAAIVVEGLRLCGADCTSETLGASIEKIKGFTVPMNVAYGPVDMGPDDHVGAGTLRFHSWDPATSSIVDGDPIVLDGAR